MASTDFNLSKEVCSEIEEIDRLEVNNGSEKMDIRAAQTAIPEDKPMATVDKIDRGQNN